MVKFIFKGEFGGIIERRVKFFECKYVYACYWVRLLNANGWGFTLAFGPWARGGCPCLGIGNQQQVVALNINFRPSVIPKPRFSCKKCSKGREMVYLENKLLASFHFKNSLKNHNFHTNLPLYIFKPPKYHPTT